MKDTSIKIRLTSELKEWMDREAARLGCTLADMIRDRVQMQSEGFDVRVVRNGEIVPAGEFFAVPKTVGRSSVDEEVQVMIVVGILPPETPRERSLRLQRERVRQATIERERELARTWKGEGSHKKVKRSSKGGAKRAAARSEKAS
jgi:hypothetical protein